MSRMTRTPRARAVGYALRTVREKNGLSAREVGRRIGIHPTLVGRIEGATKVLSLQDISALLGAIEASPEQRKHVLRLAQDLGRPNWHGSASHVPAQIQTLVMYEQEAETITAVSLALVPGLLQTREYAQAIIVGDRPGDGDRLMTRMGRQELLRREDPTQMTAILDESVLTRAVGGPAVMAGQLRHLLRLVESGIVDVKVLPFTAGAHDALSGPFDLLEFADAPPIVYVESLGRGEFIDEPEEVGEFIEARSNVLEIAMSTADTAALIASHAHRHAESEQTHDATPDRLA
ncbi:MULTISPECIES: helix-turn-helix domain-containing protein [Actinoalloteichus]|nr:MULTISPECIES: helix-turn-helix transcriptional regulator [Actinoalloteichus]